MGDFDNRIKKRRDFLRLNLDGSPNRRPVQHRLQFKQKRPGKAELEKVGLPRRANLARNAGAP
jgi:hypothetical protein